MPDSVKETFCIPINNITKQCIISTWKTVVAVVSVVVMTQTQTRQLWTPRCELDRKRNPPPDCSRLVPNHHQPT